MGDESSIEAADGPVAESGRDLADFRRVRAKANRETVNLMELLLRGATVDQAAKVFGVSGRTMRRWLRPDHEFGKMFRQRKDDLDRMLGAVRDVVDNPKTPPTSRLAAVVLLDTLTQRVSQGSFGDELLTEAEIVGCYHERVRRGVSR